MVTKASYQHCPTGLNFGEQTNIIQSQSNQLPYSFQVLSIIVRLCTVVLLCNLELCEGTKSYFCSAKNDQQL